jgi:hypothetical protein
MFIGHYAVALAAKRVDPKIPLWTMFISVQLLDLIWPILLLMGVEHVRIDPGNTAVTPLDFYDYPITHSLVTVVGFSVAATLVFYISRRKLTSSLVVGGGVLSHWILDAVVHRPDLPIVPGGQLNVGLGLWNSIPGTIVVELGLMAVGTALYLASTDARTRTGLLAFWSLIVFLVGVWIANLFGPPPPDVTTLAFSALALWLLIPWAYWIDRTRSVPTPTS